MAAGVNAVPVYLEADAVSTRSGRSCERGRVDVGAIVASDRLAGRVVADIMKTPLLISMNMIKTGTAPLIYNNYI